VNKLFRNLLEKKSVSQAFSFSEREIIVNAVYVLLFCFLIHIFIAANIAMFFNNPQRKFYN